MEESAYNLPWILCILPRFDCVINPAHSNSSNIEAWFAYVRMHKADSPTRYGALVGSRDMTKASQALKNNKAYDAADAGEEEKRKIIGPSEFIKFHNAREKTMQDMVGQYHSKIAHGENDPIGAFSPNRLDIAHSTKLSEFEKDPLIRLSSKTLTNGYMAALLKEEKFMQWIRLSIDTSNEEWFRNLLDDTSVAFLKKIDTVCQRMQDKIFEITVKSLMTRKSENVSFEYDLHKYHSSPKFAKLYKSLLPEQLTGNHGCCVMLFLALSRIHSEWMKDALTDSRKQRNPELFCKQTTTSITPTEENSEVNRFVGWAIFSALKKFKTGKESREKNDCVALLSSMLMREREMDDEYLNKYYDSHMSLLNRGGLTLVNKHFFEWGKSMMRIIRASFDEETINRDPQHAFEKSKKDVMGNKSLKSQFVLLCQNNAVANKVYDVFLSKTIHARFAVVFRRWKEKNVKSKHGKVALRTALKVKSSKSKKSIKSTQQPGNTTTAIETSKKRKEDEVVAPPDSNNCAKRAKHCTDNGVSG